MRTTSIASLAAWGSYTLGVSVGGSDLTQPATIVCGVLCVLLVSLVAFLSEE